MPALGHKIDANVVALYRCDEASGNLTDSVNGWTLSASGNVGAASGMIGGGRTLQDVNARFARSITSMPGLYTLFTESAYSVSWWMDLLGAAPTANQNIIVGGSTAIFGVQISTARRLTVYIGTGGTNFAFSATGAIPLSGLTHVEVTVSHGGGLSRTVSVYVNGVLSGTASPVSPTSFGAVTGSFQVGFTGGTSLPFLIDDLCVSNVARTSAEVIETYERGMGRGFPKLGHVLDANTYALWRCDESTASTNLFDATKNAYHITQTNSPGSAVGVAGGGRAFVAASNTFFSASARPSCVALFQAGNYTLECWLNPGSAYQGVVSYIFNQGQSTTAGSTTALLGTLNVSTSGAVRFGWAPTINLATTTGVLTLNAWTHIAVRVTSTSGGTTRAIEIFRNGVADGSATGLTPPTGGASFGVRFGHISTGSGQWGGTLDDLRISSVARTDSEILTSYQRGIGMVPETSLVRPTLRAPLTRRRRAGIIG